MSAPATVLRGGGIRNSEENVRCFRGCCNAASADTDKKRLPLYGARSRRDRHVTLSLFDQMIFTSIARRYARNQIGVAAGW